MSYTVNEIRIMVAAGAHHFSPKNESYEVLLAEIDRLTAINTEAVRMSLRAVKQVKQLEAALAEKEKELREFHEQAISIIGDESAKRINAEADNARLAERIHEAYEIYAGMEGFEPLTAPEGYCLSIIKKMAQALKPS